MTAFDVFAILMLAVSALVGFSRGAVRELVTVFAFSLAAGAAVFCLPFTGPLLRHRVHPDWAGNAAAVVIVFVVAYVLVRTLGGMATTRIRQTSFGGVDRSVGLGFGVVRALVLLGAFYLVFNAVTPPELSPSWISGGLTYPVARASGRTLAKFAPTGMKAAGGFGHLMKDGVARGFSDPEQRTDYDTAAPADSAYDAASAPAEPVASAPTPRHTSAHSHRHTLQVVEQTR